MSTFWPRVNERTRRFLQNCCVLCITKNAQNLLCPTIVSSLFLFFIYFFLFSSEIEYSKNLRYFLSLPFNIEIFFDEKDVLLFYYFRVSLSRLKTLLKILNFKAISYKRHKLKINIRGKYYYKKYNSALFIFLSKKVPKLRLIIVY